MKSQITKILMFLSFLAGPLSPTLAQETQPSPDTVMASDPSPLMPVTPAGQAVSQQVTVPSGTTLAIQLVDSIDSEMAKPGETFHATLDSPLVVVGDIAIPSGYGVEEHIVDVKSAGKFTGQSLRVLQLDGIVVGSKYYNLDTDQYKRDGNSRGKNTAAKVGGGTAIGAIIGALAGGGKGAAIGAVAGGGLGGGVQAATKGKQIHLPIETVLNFAPQEPLTVIPTTQSPNATRPVAANQ